MAEIKLNVSDPKTGKTKQVEIKDPKALMGLKIGDNFKGELLDMQGYEFEITGGSDHCGFPMRKGIPGVRKKILTRGGVGFQENDRKGIRRRKTVCGEALNPKIMQINVKIIKPGKKSLWEETKVETEGEAAPAEAKAE